MAIHKDFPKSPHAILPPETRWFPADEALREKSYEKLTPPYYFAQREAMETIIYLHDVVKGKDKYDLLRFDSSEAVSAGKIFMSLR